MNFAKFLRTPFLQNTSGGYSWKFSFTDTDSIFHGTVSKNNYSDFLRDQKCFDLNQYSNDSKYYDPSIKKSLEYLKQQRTVNIEPIICLMSEINSYLANDDSKKT